MPIKILGIIWLEKLAHSFTNTKCTTEKPRKLGFLCDLCRDYRMTAYGKIESSQASQNLQTVKREYCGTWSQKPQGLGEPAVV
jgi:hypothetical protein